MKFYKKMWFKNLFIIIIPVLISIVGFFGGSVGTIWKVILSIAIIILVIALAVFVYISYNYEDINEKKYKQAVETIDRLTLLLAHMENDNKTYKNMITTFSKIFENWALKINSFANTVLKAKQVSNKAWDKIAYFNTICEQCKNMIQDYSGETHNLSVGFVMCWENAEKVKMVRMVAHSEPQNVRPRACKKDDKLSDCLYYYGELIRNESSDISIAVNNDEVTRIFKKSSITTDLSKYTQYIAIPVYCTDNKILGIFQVVTMYDCVIESDKAKLKEFAQEKILPYSNLIVLADKISKGLYVNPVSVINEE